MAEPRGTAIDLSETAGDPKWACPNGHTTGGVLNRCLHRQEGNRFPSFRSSEGGDGLNFWDTQNRGDRGCPGGPCGNQAGGSAPRCSLPADGIGDDQWTDLRK